jgi:spermidine synthase
VAIGVIVSFGGVLTHQFISTGTARRCTRRIFLMRYHGLTGDVYRLSTMKKNSTRREPLLSILTCFFLSGAAGLIYQVAWGKALGLIFGHTAYAIATVLAVFMAGLAAGSAFFGRWRKDESEPTALYSRIEFLAGITGALSLAGLAGVRSLYFAEYPLISSMQPLLPVLRFLGVAVVLFMPTFLMGGTLPVLVRAVTRNPVQLRVRVSQLYWVNTFGALTGTLISGFVLLPAFGLRLTVGVAVGLNVIAGLIASRIAKESASPREVRGSISLKVSVWKLPQELSPRLLLILFAVVGATAFAYEIAWTRLLAVEIGSSTYAFTLILAAFLAGTVIGSMAFQRFYRGAREVAMITFSRTQTWIGVAALLSLIFFHWIPSVIPPLLSATHQTFGGLVLAQAATSALTVLPMAAIFGFNFPAVLVLLDGAMGAGAGSSSIIGKAYAANTLGAIAGSLITGFLLVPWLGSFRVIAATAAVNILLALVLDWFLPQRQMRSLAVNFTCLVMAFVIGFSTLFNNPSLLSLSAALYGNTFQGRLTLEEIAATNDLVFSTEGVNGSIAVIRSDNYVALRVNGKVDASTGDARTQLLLGHLGAAFHPAPRRVLIVGFGSGMTVSAVARYPDVERIDCVEIEPAVMRAVPYLESLNREVLNDPRVHVIFDDARDFLLTSPDKYDLIISEPSNPWIAGIATLFTNEFYAAARQRLAPGGIFVQWVQAYSLAPDDLRMIVATLAPHFPEVTLWRGEAPDLLLLGRIDPAPFQFKRLRAVWQNAEVRKDFQSVDVQRPEGLVAYYLLDDAAVRKLGEGGVLNTDDRTLLEYHAPETLLTQDLFTANQEVITQLRTGPLPANLEPSEVRRALEAGVETALDLKEAPNAQRFLNALNSQPESVSRDVAQGRLELMRDALPEAKSALQAALKLEPNAPEALHWLAVAENRDGETVAARVLVDKILEQDPHYLPALSDEMEFAADRKDYRVALLAQLSRMRVLPDPPASEYCRLGAIWIKMSNLTEAEPVLLKGTLKDPYSYACNLELGELYRETNRFALARERFETVIRLYPDSDVSVYKSLAGLYFSVGDTKSAQATLRKGHRIFPDDSELQKASAVR